MAQEAAPVVPDLRVQLVELKAPAVELLTKFTLPVGVIGVFDVSLTVAVQVVLELTTTGEGAQITDVEVGRVP